MLYYHTELTRPSAPKSCISNHNANYNCSCTQYTYPPVGCQQLITAGAGGYPTPNVTWLFNGTVATNDNQNLLDVRDDGTVSNYTVFVMSE